ncbi:hypothetical protein [Xenorhabdus cabanillasii]|uniref:Uncharacterized protein n=1 Tax=Xenorhabdus cabanillasii JM26 TaxID=1427517 RepID=W1JCQ0_9GAMM|nr:hypothetical protein [Xenorhabdus cabanillasii]PHM79142.1 hypothetical protein Xcab_00224 [Xenorhabdus cabanillasii JM26]CDL87535.1 conserved hypothetical protein [Xenorhabdus cabanillasii JM26]
MATTKDTLTTTISLKADLIIGQSLPVTVTLESEKVINLVTTQITFTDASANIIVPTGNILLKKAENDGHKATCVVTLKVINSAQDKAPIKFTIKASSSDAEPFVFTGTARTIDKSTLSLMFDKKFLDIKNVTDSSVNNDVKVIATTTLLDMDGEALSNIPILVRTRIPGNLLYCSYKDRQGTPISVIQIGVYNLININSDAQGNIEFYIYPQQAHSMVLDLESFIMDAVNPVKATSPLFLANTEIPDFLNSIPEPNILGGFPGPLTSNTGSPDFSVGVFHYPNATSGDYILFFTKEKGENERKYSGHYVPVVDPDKELGLEKYTYKVPYDIFKIGVPYDFNCIVILGKYDTSITSLPTDVTYMGGAKYSPSPSIDRKYDPCKVYTSLGFKGGEIYAGSAIGYDSIKKYLDNPDGSTGLFIEVVGDKNSKTKVPLGAKVTLNMYIEALNRNTKIVYDTKIMKSKLDPETKRYSLFFHIKFKDLVNILPYDNGGAGTIWFDYEFGVENNKSYGKIWEGEIDTRSGFTE